MKATTNEKSKLRQTNVTVDPSLDDKYGDKVLFPEKVAKAKAFLGKNGLPEGWGAFKPRQEE